MRRLSTLLRAALVAGAAVAMLGTTAAPAAAQPVSEPFRADLRDNCVLAYTEGTLTWPDPLTATARDQVAVRGRIAEHSVCEPSSRRVFALFEAFAGNLPVDHRVVYAQQNSWTPELPEHQFHFVLANGTSSEPISRIQIRVCRDFGPMLPAYTCGTTQVYHAPSHIWPPIPGPTPVPA